MRLWSISPTYLDRQGLLAVWREALLGQSVLLKGEYTKCPDCLGKTYIFYNKELRTEKCLNCKGTGKIKTSYYNHPQLTRFKNHNNPINAIKYYLLNIYWEAKNRGYKFDLSKAVNQTDKVYNDIIPITKGQLSYEFEHLQNKLKTRDKNKWFDNDLRYKGDRLDNYNKYKILCDIKPHPLFKVVEGDIENWEKIK